jgi:N-acetyl sugar amidotransferase
LRWCKRCVLPDTRPNLELDSEGVCNACRAHERRPEIDWNARADAWQRVVAEAKRRSTGYDCLIPVSGGKDSTWQVVTCLEAGLNPLAVTWKTPARTAIGERNLANLVSLGVDHIDYQVSPAVERKFMLEALRRFGVTGIPMHMAIFNIPLTLAVRLGIPVVVWGENSAVEYGSDDERLEGARLDADWLQRFGVMHGTTARDWVSDELTEKELTPYFGPSPEELEVQGTVAIFLGHYFPWDPEGTADVARAHGFEAGDRPRTGYYDYADIDDDFISLHHWFKWPKFGFTRTFDNLSIEIRNKRIGRDAAIDVIRDRREKAPNDDIERFCVFVGIERAEFDEIVERFRNREIWTQREDGTWVIEDFLVPDFDWKAVA